MIQLSISAACAYVRKVLDELVSVEEIGMLASPDAVDIHKLVEGFIVEAAVKVHSNAPSLLIDGVVAGDTDYVTENNSGVIKITMNKDCVRIASIKMSDSDVVICDLIPENSAEGRKQLNTYTRGTYDDPRAVIAKTWADNYKPIVYYYSAKDAGTMPTLTLEYVPYPVIVETIIEICPRLEYAVLNELSAMVLDSLNEHEKANIYRAKASEYKEGK